MYRREGEGLRAAAVVALAVLAVLVLPPSSQLLASSADDGGSSIASPRLDEAPSAGLLQPHPLSALPIPDTGPDLFVAANTGVLNDDEEDAPTGTIPFVSDTTWSVSDSAGTFLGLAQNICLNDFAPSNCPPGATLYDYPYDGWTADLSSIPGATWIWAPAIDGTTSPAFPAEFFFSKVFDFPGVFTGGTTSVAVDDFAEVRVNGMFVGTTGSVTDESLAGPAHDSLATFDILPYLLPGTNVITIRAANGFFGCGDGPYNCNPAGVVFGGSLNLIDNPPTALAAATPMSGYIGTQILFDATGSTDDVGLTAHLWDFGDGEMNTNPLATHAYAVRGAFIVSLTVWDSADQNDTDGLTIQIENRPPTASATATAPPIFRGQIVVLDGTGSGDPDGDSLTFSWSKVSGPEVTLTGANTATASFIPTELGTYVFNLTVDDGFGGIGETSVAVTPLNRNPVANAGPDQTTAAKNVLLALDATGSVDPDGDALTYAWTAPTGITLSDPNDAMPAFTAIRSGTCMFLLRADDGFGGADSDTIVVTVLNARPVAVATAPITAPKYSAVPLDGLASSDPDGDGLAYVWSQISGPPVVMNGAGTATADFTPSVSGTYVFELTVDDGDFEGTDSVQVTVSVSNAGPSVDAGSSFMARKGTQVFVYGIVSDPDGDALVVAWSQVSGPASVTLNGGTTNAADFFAPVLGTYVLQFTAADTEGLTDSDQVTVTVWGLAPTAVITASVTTVEVEVSITFDGSGSSDLDGTIVDYAFDFGDGTPPVSGPSSAQAHAFSRPGFYIVWLVVADDDGNVSSASVAVEVVIPLAPANVNWKPLVAAVFAAVLIALGASSSRRSAQGHEGGRSSAIVAFATTSLPFVLAEAATGILSHFTGLLSIPPLLGVGAVVDGGILAAGVTVAVLRGRSRSVSTSPDAKRS